MPDSLRGLNLFHVDVFASGPLTGNGLTVFLGSEDWSAGRMQSLTQEMRQFESIFLSSITDSSASARVFTAEEELPFAGHPVLGAAAVLHRVKKPTEENCEWTISLPVGLVSVTSQSRGNGHFCEMNQGLPAVLSTPDPTDVQPILQRLNLTLSDLHPGISPQVITTGLPYLILPVSSTSLAKASIVGTDLENWLAAISAKFIVLLDPLNRELRTWDNLGKVEDIATGSAAGPAAAYLISNQFSSPETPILFQQGRFAGRPSLLTARQNSNGEILISGEVWPISSGTLEC